MKTNVVIGGSLDKKKKFGEYPTEIQKIMKIAKFKGLPVKIHGSASKKGQKYPSDYDLYTDLPKKLSARDTFAEIKKIISKIDKSKDHYLIEIKLQTPKEKIRWNPDDNFDFKEFEKYYDDANMIKFDFVIWLNDKFNIVDISYIFDKDKEKELKEKDFIDEIKRRIDEKNYFKALKRLSSYYSYNNDKKNYNEVNKILNSNLGKLYFIKSNLEAIELVDNYYDDPETLNKINRNLAKLNYPENININNEITKIEKIINKEAKAVLDKLKLPF